MGNHGESTWWVGAFVTFAAASMCLQSRREVAWFSLFALACALVAAAAEGQLRHSIYVPGLATILLLANVTKHSQTIAQDATLRAERAGKESRRADEQRLQLAAIVESSGDAIVASSLDGVIRSWNKAAERLFGYTAEEMIGRPISQLLVPGRQAEEPSLVARLGDGVPVAPFETLRRRKDGSDLDVSVTVSPVREAGGKLVGASIVARDISDWKRAEAEIRRAREAAEAANRDLEAFNYSVAHDLRAPLRAIDGFSQILLEDHGKILDAAGRGHLQRVRAAAQRMGRLIDSLLALGHVTRVGIRSQRVDLSELARATAERLRESQPDRVVEFVIGEGFTEMGDSALLGAAIENLLSNAWKFTRNQPNARIEFGSVREGGRDCVLRPRQRRRLRHGVRLEALRRLSAAAHAERVRGDRRRPGDRPADRATPRRARVGGGHGGQGGLLPLHVRRRRRSVNPAFIRLCHPVVGASGAAVPASSGQPPDAQPFVDASSGVLGLPPVDALMQQSVSDPQCTGPTTMHVEVVLHTPPAAAHAAVALSGAASIPAPDVPSPSPSGSASGPAALRSAIAASAATAPALLQPEA